MLANLTHFVAVARHVKAQILKVTTHFMPLRELYCVAKCASSVRSRCVGPLSYFLKKERLPKSSTYFLSYNFCHANKLSLLLQYPLLAGLDNHIH